MSPILHVIDLKSLDDRKIVILFFYQNYLYFIPIYLVFLLKIINSDIYCYITFFCNIYLMAFLWNLNDIHFFIIPFLTHYPNNISNDEPIQREPIIIPCLIYYCQLLLITYYTLISVLLILLLLYYFNFNFFKYFFYCYFLQFLIQ